MRATTARAAGIPAVAAAVTLSLGLVPAQASRLRPVAGAPGWRVVEVVGPAGGTTSFDAAAAAGRGAAWSVGTTCGATCTNPALLVQRWNGRSWRRLRTPAGVATPTAPLESVLVGASSGRSAWVFANLAGSGAKALRWNGRWKVFRFPAGSSFSSTAVLSRTNAWAFGSISAGNKQVPYNVRFNGRSWRRVPLPAYPGPVSALSPADMWAVGSTAASLRSGTAVWKVLHWNGRSWRTMSWPKIQVRSGSTAYPWGIAAAGPRALWAEAVIQKRGDPAPTGIRLLRWDGRRWHRVPVPYPATVPYSMAQDGHGGVWLENLAAGPSREVHLYHYSNGHWSSQLTPMWHGSRVWPGALAWIPGSRSLWAAGGVGTAPGAGLGTILKYGN